MRFLCDHNIGSTIANAPAGEGHDVARAVHVLPRAPDEVVLRHAVEGGRILITCDRDFGELVFKHGHCAPRAIIYIRFKPQDVTEIVPRLLAMLDFERLQHHMTVIGGEGDRRTSYPRKKANDG